MNSESVIEEQKHSNALFGFWVYIMTDCVLFASLFATFAVLRNNTFGGESGRQLFSLPFVLTETMVLLFSSYSCGLAMLAAHRADKKKVIMWFVATFVLGATFLTMELTEFAKLHTEGNGWERSAFLSSFFTLVGTHGLHIAVGLLWIAVLLVRVSKGKLNASNIKKLSLLSLFWHFLDIVWIFIFTFVYLMGAR